MTTVLLIRHGQASFGAGDYDRLCELGCEQARILGVHLLRERHIMTSVVSGTLRRQRDTAVHALAAMGVEATVTTDSRFDEYSTDDLLAAYLGPAAQRLPEIARAQARYRHDPKLFQTVLSTVLNMWLAGETGATRESWSEFQSRIRTGLESAVAHSGKTGTVAIFTSGGVIATAVGYILGLCPEAILKLHWRIPNCAVTELYYGRTGWSLIGFNLFSHLRVAGEAMVTYR